MTKYTGALLKGKRREENVILRWIKHTNIIWLVCRGIICRTLGFSCQNESDHISDGFILQAGTRTEAQPPLQRALSVKKPQLEPLNLRRTASLHFVYCIISCCRK